MSVLKGRKNQERILSILTFPVENCSGPLVRRDKKQGDLINYFSLLMPAWSSPRISTGSSSVCEVKDEGKAKHTRAMNTYCGFCTNLPSMASTLPNTYTQKIQMKVSGKHKWYKNHGDKTL